MAFKKYCVQFSEEDMTHIDDTYGRMNIITHPTPAPGNFVVRPSGIFEIESAYLSAMDNHWDVYLRPVDSQCEDGDTILVLNKDRMFRCHKNTYEYGFKKVSLYTLMCAIDELTQKQDELTEKHKELMAKLDRIDV